MTVRATLADGFSTKVVSLEAALAAHHDSGKVVWIELAAQDKDALAQVADVVKLHPLTLRLPGSSDPMAAIAPPCP